MTEYIEREAAMDIFGDVPMRQGYYEPYPWEVHCAIVGIVKLFKEEISKIPAADVAPVVHGRWRALRKYDARRTYRCSVCGRTIRLSLAIDINEYAPYCNCGARMDGGSDAKAD